MRALFYRYRSVCEPDMLDGFRALGIDIVEEDSCAHGEPSTRDWIQHMMEVILDNHVRFVFSVNFFPYLSEVCNTLKLPYVCWVVDCPVLELMSNSVKNNCNEIFIFDHTLYRRIAPQNPGHIHYLPLASNPDRWEQVLLTATEEDLLRFHSDISFVGSLYNEKSPLDSIPLDEHLRGYVDGLIESQLTFYGYNLLEDAISDECVNALKQYYPPVYQLSDTFENLDCYIAAHYYVGMRAAELERTRTLNMLAKRHSVVLYTESDTSALENVACRGSAATLSDMPKIFALSKINLNITIRPIQSGLSQRVWDVLGCGGFLLSNYQSEIPEYFEIGTDLDCYESAAELEEKVSYYLTHDEIREEIAASGYAKVKNLHTCRHRIAAILSIVLKKLS